MLCEKNGDRCQGDPKALFHWRANRIWSSPLSEDIAMQCIGEQMPSQTESGAPLSVRTSFATPIDPRNLSGDVR